VCSSAHDRSLRAAKVTVHDDCVAPGDMADCVSDPQHRQAASAGGVDAWSSTKQRKAPIPREQLRIGPLFPDAPVFQEHNQIRTPDCGEGMVGHA